MARKPRIATSVVTHLAARKARAKAKAARRMPRIPQTPHRGPTIRPPRVKCSRCVCLATAGHSTCTTCRVATGGVA